MSSFAKPLYLTKSRFNMALECPTKLYYSTHSKEYFDKNQNNDFLKALADGGFLIGELAKYKYHPDPVGESITIEALDHEKAIDDTVIPPFYRDVRSRNTMRPWLAAVLV